MTNEIWAQVSEELKQAVGANNHTTWIAPLRFEALVEAPFEHLRVLAEFCGLSPTEAALQQACVEVEPARGSSFCRDAELSARYEAVRETPVMQRLGYDTAAPLPAADGGAR